LGLVLVLGLGDCAFCPVKKHTGESECNATPYKEWITHHASKHKTCDYPLKTKCKTCVELAKKEAKFLEGLR
jgi:hypothetical protein